MTGEEIIDQIDDFKKKIKWLPLEGNPEVWNKIIHNQGIDPSWNFVDILGFDPELMALIPDPSAIIFLFPITENTEKDREKEEAHIKIHEQNISPNLIYYKQTISNACGMMALIHSIMNQPNIITGPGVFQTLLNETLYMSPEERAEYLEGFNELAMLHESSALEGQTETPDISEQLRLHFICFVNVDNHLYELDGRKSFPINHGKCIDFVQGAVKIMNQFIEKNPDEKEFSAIALTKT